MPDNLPIGAIPGTYSGLPGGEKQLATGPDGNLWFTECTVDSGERQCINSGIGRITPGGQIAEFPLPMPSNQLGEIIAGPDGNLWFTENDHTDGIGLIGRITTGK
jgi:virginiamycin B lyase